MKVAVVLRVVLSVCAFIFVFSYMDFDLSVKLLHLSSVC